MKNIDAFSGYSPVINFIFYIGAIVYGMFFLHPVFLLCSLCLSAAYYVTVKGRRAWRMIGGLVPLLAAVSALNPLFNTRGWTVLFELFGRPYTLEALIYGMALAAMLASVVMWFASYNEVMTSDKFLYIFGRAAPAASLVLTMALRLVPNYLRKFNTIISARECIGRGLGGQSSRQRAANGLVVVSSLVSWALESGVATADSMRSRGYGSGGRSNFSIYRFALRDRILLCVLVLLAAVIMYCGLNGAAEVSYTPKLVITGFDNIYTTVGSISYLAFLSIPTVLNLKEEIIWRVLRSRI